MTFPFVMPKGIQLEVSLGAGGTAQPDAQMNLAHVGTNGYPGGGWSLTAPLKLALINPLMPPTFNCRGAMWVGMATCKAWEMAMEEASCANMSLSSTGAEGLGLTSLSSWEDSLDTVVVGPGDVFRRGWGRGQMGMWQNTPQKPI